MWRLEIAQSHYSPRTAARSRGYQSGVRCFSFPGSAWERHDCEALPRQAEPGVQCVSRQSLGTRISYVSPIPWWVRNIPGLPGISVVCPWRKCLGSYLFRRVAVRQRFSAFPRATDDRQDDLAAAGGHTAGLEHLHDVLPDGTSGGLRLYATTSPASCRSRSNSWPIAWCC